MMSPWPFSLRATDLYIVQIETQLTPRLVSYHSDTMSQVDFSALINDELVAISSSREWVLILALKEHLHDIPSSACKFYRMRNPVPVGSPTELDDTPLVQVCAVKENRIPIHPVKTKVGELAPELSFSYIYVVVDIPGVPRKRTAEEVGILDWVRSAKIGKFVPSGMGFEQYKSLQQDYAQRLLDDRPIAGNGGTLPDDKVPPISLVYQPFGAFLDTYIGTGDKATRAPPLLKDQVDDFAYQMTLIHDDEDSRRVAALPLLNRIFGEALGTTLPIIAPANIGNYTTDGSILGIHGEPILLVEFEKDSEASGVSSIPIVQLCSYYIQCVRRVDENIILSSRMPALGLTIVGPVVTFHAIALCSRVHSTPLTSSLSCVYRAVDGNDRRKLYDAFAAAVNLLRRITHDCSIEPLSPLKDRLFPAITELPSSEDPSISIKFEITKSIITSPGRYIYEATSSNAIKLVIKFTRRYSLDLHMHCFREGHAPKLRGYAKLPGNIIAVATDFVDNTIPLDSNEASLDDRKIWADQLTRLVDSFHAADYVHGDLQYPNILVADNKVMLIDYDWAGKEGEVSYPHGRLAPRLTEGRDRSDLMITKEDDRRVLAITLKEIGIGSQS